MERFNFNKIGTGVLLFAFITGCNSNTQVNTTKVSDNPVSSVKATEVKTVDLGTQNGGTFKVNLKFQDKQKFHLKNEFATNTSVSPFTGFYLQLRLFRTTHGSGGLTPKNRFDAPYTINHTDIGNVDTFNITSPGSIQTVVFKGLQQGYDYYISSRVYSPPYDLSGKNISVLTDSTLKTISNSSIPAVPGPGTTSYSLAGLILNPTDVFILNGNEIAEVNSPPTTPNFDNFTYTPRYFPTGICCNPITSGVTSQLTSFYRNVVGVGNVGDGSNTLNGMAADDSQPGGGTAPAYTGSASSLNAEEYIDFSNPNLVIVNDDTLLNSSGTRVPNNTLDMEINLMESLGADVNGNVAVNQGSFGPGEKITP